MFLVLKYLNISLFLKPFLSPQHVFSIIYFYKNYYIFISIVIIFYREFYLNFFKITLFPWALKQTITRIDNWITYRHIFLSFSYFKNKIISIFKKKRKYSVTAKKNNKLKNIWGRNKNPTKWNKYLNLLHRKLTATCETKNQKKKFFILLQKPRKMSYILVSFFFSSVLTTK